LPVAHYRFTARVSDTLMLPHYSGSLLRGQFGAALRHVACMTHLATCPGCPLLQTCPYSRLFETPVQQRANPYVLEPPSGSMELQTGDSLEFGLTLVGQARDQLALVIFALQRALARGLTKLRVPAELLQVDWVDAANTPHTVWTNAMPVLQEHPAELVFDASTRTLPSEITLHIYTPMRLQHQGHPLRADELTPHILLANLARRTVALLAWHGAAPPIAALGQHLRDARQLRWYDWTRYSSRQQQEMTLGGVLGTWTLHGNAEVLEQIFPWLWLGQWLHVGKNTTMGMGGYRLEMT